MTKFQSILGYCLVIIIWCTAIQLAYKYYENYEPNQIPIKLEQPEFFLSDTPDINQVYEACEYYEIKHPQIVVAQAILETGNFKSDKCVKDNNLFGLYNSRRKQYFKFNHWTDCIQAYRDKIQYRYKDKENYYDFLIRIGYAEDPEYVIKLKSIIKRYKLK